MIYNVSIRCGQHALPAKISQRHDLNIFCASHQTKIGLSKKILDRQSVECRIRIVAVQYLSGSGAIAPKIAESVR
jgi:hypothetical protein